MLLGINTVDQQYGNFLYSNLLPAEHSINLQFFYVTSMGEGGVATCGRAFQVSDDAQTLSVTCFRGSGGSFSRADLGWLVGCWQ